MDLDLASSAELDKRSDRIINSQTILKTPEKPPSPVYNYRQNHVTNVLLAGNINKNNGTVHVLLVLVFFEVFKYFLNSFRLKN